MKLQATINKIDDWAKNWRIQTNQSKSKQITFSLHKQTCPTVQMVNVDLTQKNEVKYMGIHLDRRLTKHINTKRQQLKLEALQKHWLLRGPTPTTESKLLYKAVFEPTRNCLFSK
jgi:hypothetical protein